jgi:hypothetical protein
MHNGQIGSTRGNTREKPGSIMTSKRLSISSRPQLGVNGIGAIRPIASKNMPQCFRENPNSRKRVAAAASDYRDMSTYEPSQIAKLN